MPSNSTLTLFFDYTFKLEESAWKQAWDTFAKVVKWARAPTGKKEEKTEQAQESTQPKRSRGRGGRGFGRGGNRQKRGGRQQGERK